MKRKSKREQEVDESLASLIMWYKIFTKERYTKAFVKDIMETGEQLRRMLLILSGKETDD